MKIFKIRLSTIHYASGVLDISVYEKYIKCLSDYYISIGDIKNCDDFSYHIWCDYLNLRDNSILRIFSGGMMDVTDDPESKEIIRDLKIKKILENG